MSELLLRQIEVLETENDELRERVRQLEAMIAPVEEVMPLEFLILTPAEQRLVAALYSNGRCSKEFLHYACCSDATGSHEQEIKIVDVFVCKARKKLKPYGIEITTLWGQGYLMPKDSKAIIDELKRKEAA